MSYLKLGITQCICTLFGTFSNKLRFYKWLLAGKYNRLCTNKQNVNLIHCAYWVVVTSVWCYYSAIYVKRHRLPDPRMDTGFAER